YNEALANVVAEEGVKRWLAFHGRNADLRHFEERLVRRRQFYDRIDATRDALEQLYASGRPAAEMRVTKQRLFGELRREFRALRKRWGGRGLEGWLTMALTNAHLISVATY